MANFEGMSLPAYGAGVHYNESLTANWTIADDGRLLLNLASTRPGETTGIEIAMALSSTTPTTAFNLLLSRSSTKAATTDALLGLEMGAAAYGVSGIQVDMGAAAVLTNFLSINGTAGPTYFLNVGPASGGAAQAVGFFSPSGKTLTTAPSSTTNFGTLKCMAGSKAYYIPILPDTAFT